MNIIEIPFVVDAKTMSNQKNNKIYPIILVNRLSLCSDKDDIMLTQINAHQRLLDLSKGQTEPLAVEKEISKLKLAIELMKD